MINTTGDNDTDSYELILKQAAGSKNPLFNLSKTYPAYIVLAFFIGLSFLVMQFFKNQTENSRNNEFDKSLNSVITRFEKKEEINMQIIGSIKEVYGSLIQIVRHYFDIYASIPPKTYNSIISIIWTQPVHREELGIFTENVRRTGLYDYKVFPASSKKIFYPVEYIVPQYLNNHVSGFDLGSQPLILKAIEKSRDSNSLAATPNFIIRKPDTLGFYMIVPVYKKDSQIKTIEERRRNFEGCVLLEIYSPEFFEEALGGGVPSDTNIIFQCFDNDTPSDNKMIFQSGNSALLDKKYERYRKNRNIRIGDRDIEVQFSTVPNFGGSFQEILPMIAFGISLILSFAFFGFVLSVTTSRARALDLAERMTRSQRRIVESSKDIIAVLDFNGKWKSMNQASSMILGYEPKEMLGSKIDDLFVLDKDLRNFYDTAKSVKGEFTLKSDLQMKSRSGEIIWLSWNLTYSAKDALIYCVGRDVTKEKQVEELTILRNKQNRLEEQEISEANEQKITFMTKLSHQLRNSLTGILGFLHLALNKDFDSVEELDNYLAGAEESSEELFDFISVIEEVALTNTDGTYRALSTVCTCEIINDTISKLIEVNPGFSKTKIEIGDEDLHCKLAADYKTLQIAIGELLSAFTSGAEKPELQITTHDNQYESAVEIQILSNSNRIVSEMIEIFKNNSDNLKAALVNDKEDILLRMAIAASCVRILKGSINIETLGEEGNIAQITLPSIREPVM